MEEAIPEMSARLLTYVRESFEREIAELLDDPSWMLAEGDDWMRDHMSKLRAVGEEIGLDFDALAGSLGSPYEIDRLRVLEEEGRLIGLTEFQSGMAHHRAR